MKKVMLSIIAVVSMMAISCNKQQAQPATQTEVNAATETAKTVDTANQQNKAPEKQETKSEKKGK